jgi:hypothetical protein
MVEFARGVIEKDASSLQRGFYFQLQIGTHLKNALNPPAADA